MKLRFCVWGVVTLALVGCANLANSPDSAPIAESPATTLPPPPDPMAANPGPSPTLAPAIELGPQLSQAGGGLGDSPVVFDEAWGPGTLEENFVGWQGLYANGTVIAYFRDFNGTEAEGDRAEQVVLNFGTASADSTSTDAAVTATPAATLANPSASQPAATPAPGGGPITAAAALAQALTLAPADAQPDRIWQPSPDTFAYLYNSATLAQALPEYQGDFVVWFQLDAVASPAAPPSPPVPTADAAPQPDSLPPGTLPPERVLQVQLISGSGDNL